MAPICGADGRRHPGRDLRSLRARAQMVSNTAPKNGVTLLRKHASTGSTRRRRTSTSSIRRRTGGCRGYTSRAWVLAAKRRVRRRLRRAHAPLAGRPSAGGEQSCSTSRPPQATGEHHLTTHAHQAAWLSASTPYLGTQPADPSQPEAKTRILAADVGRRRWQR